MTDHDFIELVMAEGREYLAGVRLATRYDRGEMAAPDYYRKASANLRSWNAARDAVRAALIDRIESESAVSN